MGVLEAHLPVVHPGCTAGTVSSFLRTNISRVCLSKGCDWMSSCRQSTALGLVVPACSCTTQTDSDLDFEDVRAMSDTFCSHGDEPTDVGASNMVWAWVRSLWWHQTALKRNIRHCIRHCILHHQFTILDVISEYSGPVS